MNDAEGMVNATPFIDAHEWYLIAYVEDRSIV